MKKTILQILVLLVVSIQAMAGEIIPTVVLKTKNDSVNYAVGVANGDNIRKNCFKDLPVELAIKHFMKYFEEAFHSGKNEKIPLDTTTIYFGISKVGIYGGNKLKEQLVTGLMGNAGFKVDFNLLQQGLLHGMRATEGPMKVQEALDFLNKTTKELENKQLDPETLSNKLAGEEFLAKNKNRPWVKTTNSGLQYEVIQYGTGPLPVDSSNVKILYYGKLIDGTMFDNSDKHPKSHTFHVSEIQKGLKEILKLMPVGSIFKAYIPQDLAFGNSQSAIVKPYSALIFEIRLMGIE